MLLSNEATYINGGPVYRRHSLIMRSGKIVVGISYILHI